MASDRTGYVSGHRYVSDYRLLPAVLYKSITKIIVKRLQQVLPLMIDYSQNAFVPGRSITDNILLAQELMAASFQSRLMVQYMVFSKAGEDFVRVILCRLICLFWLWKSGTCLRFRINEAADFQYHWKCKDIGLINLCFADDVLLFCKAHLPSIMVITDTLNEFAALSGLKVNRQRVRYSLRAVQQERQQILDYLGFQEGSLPVKYLGIPLTSSRLTIADCRPLIDKVDARLAGWNNQILSYAGRCNSLSLFLPRCTHTGLGLHPS
ncbi:UNVERIFIED_CONTAM: hypothetical protein Sangu_3224900 [Sesamum angustifolium]|uniref:Reverse transcriptase domain-containing protein n=1 Tax=Sesamum angustifolium TaxID=2727405 RepID=A0AAW2JI51_9LAMI